MLCTFSVFPSLPSRTGSKLGISPLMLAAMNGHTSTVKLLLDMGSDINAQVPTAYSVCVCVCVHASVQLNHECFLLITVIIFTKLHCVLVKCQVQCSFS